MHLIFARLARPRGFWTTLRRDTRGAAMLEFALSAPLAITMGLYAVEYANLAMANLRISQIAMNLADNASRVGTAGALSTQQLREVDMNDALQAARLQGAAMALTTNGRVIVSSLENNGGTQRIHWQRCIGLKQGSGWDSSYGTTTPTDGTDQNPANDGTPAPTGMGDAGSRVTAPEDSGVMFVEINYEYRPVVGSWVAGRPRIHYIASFVVRDRRDFAQIFNPNPAAPRSTCNFYNS